MSRIHLSWCLACLPLLACSDPGGKGGPGVDIVADGPTFPTSDADDDPDDGAATADDGGQPPQDVVEETAVDVGPDLTPDVPVGCPDGTACNDQDPCTVNDQCKGGTCMGTPIDCGPDDGAPCTFNGCVDGQCVGGIEEGFCYVGGVCWSDDQKNPTNACQVCDAFGDQSAWTNVTGACDDGDPCTLNDSCQAGGCSGTPVSCPDDGNPCTDNACVGGSCQVTSLAGQACDDGNACTVGDACSGTTCVSGALKDADDDGAADVACGGTDCDDTSAQAKPGLTEVCGDSLDNDCDGQTDSADDDCGGTNTGACSYQTDCYPEGVCAIWKTTGQAVCSVPCAGDVDCASGQMCSKLPGSAQVGFCEDKPQGLLPNGSGCADGVECQSGLCANGACAATCLDEAHCPGTTQTCSMVGDLAVGEVSGACVPNGGLLPPGDACLSGFDYTSEVCASGHCDFMPYPSEPLYCAPLCKTQSDCSLTQKCGVVLYSSVPNPSSILYDPALESIGTEAQKNPRDAATACFTRVTVGGSKQDGTACTGDDQCLGGLCLPLLPGDSTAYCTRLCAQDTDCGGGQQCKLELITLNSAFLQAYGSPNFPPQPGWWSYVRVCKFP